MAEPYIDLNALNRWIHNNTTVTANTITTGDWTIHMDDVTAGSITDATRLYGGHQVYWDARTDTLRWRQPVQWGGEPVQWRDEPVQWRGEPVQWEGDLSPVADDAEDKEAWFENQDLSDDIAIEDIL